MIGLCADLMSIERIGLLALSYALITWLVGTIRDYLFRHHALTQFVVTFASAAFVQVGWFVYRRTLYSIDESWALDLLRAVSIAPLYTALWAPIIHRILLTLGPMLGLPKPKYSFVGTQIAGGPGV